MGDQSLHWRVLQAAEIPMTEQSKEKYKNKSGIYWPVLTLIFCVLKKLILCQWFNWNWLEDEAR